MMARARKQKTAEQTEGVARRIWLAGLGAYGKSVEDAQGQLDKAGQEASRLFTDLVQKGQDIEDHSRDAIRSRLSEARGRLEEARSMISERASGNVRPVEEMIHRVREKMGIDGSVHAQLDALTRRVDRIAEALAMLAGSRGGPTPRAPVARKSAAARVRKTVVKDAARKPVKAKVKAKAKARRIR